MADLHAVSVGATSRWVNAERGEEVFRFGAVQRFLFRDQRITPEGALVNQRFSDILLASGTRTRAGGRTRPSSSTRHASARALGAAPLRAGAYRTEPRLPAGASGQSEQIEAAWRGRYGRPGGPVTAPAPTAAAQDAWYSSVRPRAVRPARPAADGLRHWRQSTTPAAGCCASGSSIIPSTGRAEARTQFMIQLELVGRPQLGSNALGLEGTMCPAIAGFQPRSLASTDSLP